MTIPPIQSAPDEVSLRDLYVVVRRHLVAIVAFVALVALLVFAESRARPASYRAEATTAVARAPISVQQETGLAFRPELDVTYDTYQTLAFSRGVLERVVEAVPAANLSVSGVRDAFSLERLAGAGNQPSSLLAVAHRVRHGEAEVAAELASVWSGLTIETVRSLLNENLEAIERITTDSVAVAAESVERATQALTDLRSGRGGTSDPERLTSIQQRLAELEMSADQVARLVRGREAEAASLAARLEDGADELVVLSDAREVALTVEGALWATEAQLAALRAEQEAAEEQLAALREEVERLAPSVARFQVDVERRTRELILAQRAHDSLANIEPTVAYVAQLAPTGARILSEAAIPTEPEARNTVIRVALAAVAAAFAALVFVLLREAVRDPAAPTGGGSRGGRQRSGAPGG